jgi:hypothetical protein
MYAHVRKEIGCFMVGSDMLGWVQIGLDWIPSQMGWDMADSQNDVSEDLTVRIG